MANLTIPQRKALESAAKTGNAWNAWGNVYRTSTNRMMQALCARGLLTHDGRPTDKTADALGLPVAYGVTQVGAQVITAALPEPVEHPTLADCAAKFDSETPAFSGRGLTLDEMDEAEARFYKEQEEWTRGASKDKDEPLYECEIPGAPGCITYGKDAQIVGRATRELPPGYFEGRLVSLEIDGEAVRCGFDVGGKPGVSQGFKADYEPYTSTVSFTMRDYQRAAFKRSRLVLQGAEQASLADALEASRLWGGAEIHYVCSETGRQCSAMWTMTPDGRGKYRQNLRSAAYFEFVKGGRKRGALRRKLNKYLKRSRGGV